MNNYASLIKIIPKVSSWAKQQHLISRVYFFGSRVRNQHTPTSDLDIAIHLIYPDPDTAFANWSFESAVWKSQLSAILPWKLDLHLLAPNSTPNISAGVQKSSLLVYEKHA